MLPQQFPPMFGGSGKPVSGSMTAETPPLHPAQLLQLLGEVGRQDPVYHQHSDETEYRTVGILGGGSAGYLTALAFRKFRPELDVTVIESSDLPPIGVGEATTHEMVPFLHSILGLDILEFYRDVKPTWKLGIQFDWGLPGSHFFNYPFDRGRVLESMTYDKDLRYSSVMSTLMTEKRAPMVRVGNGHYSLLSEFPYGYHIDNHRLLDYLRKQLVPAGVRHIERHIKHAQTDSKKKNIEYLIDSDGQQHRFDLYIDCSGFRSYLMEQTLGSKFVSYKDSLWNDRCLTTGVPHGGYLQPFTTAETMDAGWCWAIPQMENNHRGYVYSSDFISDEKAEAEMRRKNPEMGDVRRLEFRAGRHKHFWKGNVVAMGNSYAFVEPLESTSLQALLLMNIWFLNNFPTFRNEPQLQKQMNQRVASYWDYIRWFLAAHFKFNQKSDSKYWRATRNDIDMSGADWIVDMFKERAPLTYRKTTVGIHPWLSFNGYGYDAVLYGQGVDCRSVAPHESAEQYRRRVTANRALAAHAVTQAEALALLQNRYPEMLLDQVANPRSWQVQTGNLLKEMI
jgi:tryptophan 7-halogenase